MQPLSAAEDDADDGGEAVVLAFGTLPQGVSGGMRLLTTVTIAEPEPLVDAAAGSGGRCSVGEGADHVAFLNPLSAETKTYLLQSSRRKPATRSNSRVLFVTRTCPSDLACPAIIKS